MLGAPLPRQRWERAHLELLLFFISVLCLAKGSDKMRSRGGLAIWMKITPSLASLVASLSWTQAKLSSLNMQEWRLCICLCLVCFKSWINPSSCLSLRVYSLSSLHWCAVVVGASSQNAADRESVSFISTKQIKKNALIFFFLKILKPSVLLHGLPFFSISKRFLTWRGGLNGECNVPSPCVWHVFAASC